MEAAECDGGVAWGVGTRMFTSSATRRLWWNLMEGCVRRGDGAVAWKQRADLRVWPAHKHTHRHRTSVLRRVQHIRGDGRRKASEDQRVNWLLSPEAEAIRVFRVPRSQSPASPAPPAAGSLDKVNAILTMLGFLERFRADARGSAAGALSSAWKWACRRRLTADCYQAKGNIPLKIRQDAFVKRRRIKKKIAMIFRVKGDWTNILSFSRKTVSKSLWDSTMGVNWNIFTTKESIFFSSAGFIFSITLTNNKLR